jgi:hypothetical protein
MNAEGDNSGLVKMLLIGAIIPLGQAFIVWHWRSSVSDELSWSEATHVVVADYKPSFERALAASKGEEMVRLPQSTENAEVRSLARTPARASGTVAMTCSHATTC